MGRDQAGFIVLDMNILAISGSLRRGSYNTAALRHAVDLAPDGMKIEIHPLNGLPMYDFDVEESIGFPEPVDAFRRAAAQADGLLIASPEYNYSITGALKNALDWLSRGGDDAPWKRKPVAIFGVGGRFGTLRSQLHLREILLHAGCRIVDDIQVYIPRSEADFDDDMRIGSERYISQVERLLNGLAALVDAG